MSSNSSKHLFCTYADDFRQEVGGKHSIIGIYQGGSMTVHGSLPAVLPRMVIMAHLYCPASEDIKSIKMGVKFNDDLLIPEMIVPKQVIEQMQAQARSGPDTVGAGMQFAQVIQPLEIKVPGAIRCYAEVDGELVKGNGLEVFVVPIEGSSA